MKKNFDVSQLRDIHLPTHVAWWPPGWGWWGVILITLLSVAALALCYYRHQRFRTQRFVLKQLQAIRSNGQPAHEQMKALSILLRRTALSYFHQQTVAGLHGKAWLAFLARTADLPEMNSKTAEILIQAPYQPTLQLDPEPVFELATQWIKHITQRAPRHV